MARKTKKTAKAPSDETIRRWINEKRLPPPDVNLSRQSKGWKTSTLRAKGINV